MKHVVIWVFGRVQGVFFRVNTKKQADKLGISGWVRNRLNGAVQISASGTEPQLRSFISWCSSGSPLSKVTDIKVEWSESEGELNTGFVITQTV